MSGIICSIRGGPRSHVTIDESIRLAAQTQLPLYFLYIINLEFLSRTTAKRVEVAREEIQKMGEFILQSAREQAEGKGVLLVETVTREGEVQEQIVQLCKDIQANYVILGHPEKAGEVNVFTGQLIEEFINEVKSTCGAEVVLVQEPPE